MAGTDFSHLTNDELIKGIQTLKLPDYIRSKAYGVDVRETLAQMTEMTIQLGVNMGLSPDDALRWARKLQESVSQSEFDSWVATLLDGGPSIFMNTLSELQTTYPNGAAGVALVRETDPAKIYVWNGSAWEDFGDYQGIELKDESVGTSHIVDGAVSKSKTDFFKKNTSDMLLNMVWDDGYLTQDGSVSPSSANKVFSNFMTVRPNTVYSLETEESFGKYENIYIAFYDSEGVFKRFDLIGADYVAGEPKIIGTQTGESLIKISVPNRVASMLYWHEGETHEPRPPKYKIDTMIDSTQATFIKVNNENLLQGNDWMNGYLDADGNPVSASNNIYTNIYIRVKPSTTYSFETDVDFGKYEFIYLSKYKENKEHTERLLLSGEHKVGIPKAFETSSEEVFIRMSMPNTLLGKVFVHEGLGHIDKPEEYFLDEQIQVESRNQKDFVQLLKNHDSVGGTLKAQVDEGLYIRVYVPAQNGQFIEYTLKKDVQDDLIIIQDVIQNFYSGTTFQRAKYFVSGSNKEFAIRARPTGSVSERVWFPEHENTGTVFANYQSIKFDGEEVMGSGIVTLRDVRTVQIYQDMNFVFPGEAEPLARLIMVTTINSGGVSYQGEIEWLRDADIDRGYFAMFPKLSGKFNILKASNDLEYKTNRLIPSTDIVGLPSSFMYVNRSDELLDNSFGLAQTVINPHETYRTGKKGTRKNTIWLEHRTETIDKIYPQIYQDTIAYAGQKQKFGAQIYLGVLPHVDKLI